jgi:hypothetical protein
MFLVDLPPAEPKPESQRLDNSTTATPTPLYQAARWIRRFHEMSHVHIGWMDRTPGVTDLEVLDKYGFIQMPVIELNRIRLLLETYGPLLSDGAIVINGYADGIASRLFYRDPLCPEKQFDIRYLEFIERIRPGRPLLYVNCNIFPKPCTHIVRTLHVVGAM